MMGFINEAEAQVKSISFDLGLSYNQTLIIMPNVFGADFTYSSSPMVAANIGFGKDKLTYLLGMGWSRIKNVFPYERIPFSRESDQKRPYLALDEFFFNASIEYPVISKLGFQLSIGIGLNFSLYPIYEVLIREGPFGVLEFPADGQMSIQTITYDYVEGKSEYRSFSFGPIFWIAPSIKLNSKLRASLKIGGKLNVLDVFQNKVEYRIMGAGVDVTTDMDLKNTGSVFFSTLGLTYLFGKPDGR